MSALLALSVPMSCSLGCGPELNPIEADLRGGYYRAESIDVDDSCGTGAVWSSEVVVGYSDDAYVQFYEEPVPIRADGLRVEVPEPQAALAEVGIAAGIAFEETPWRMRPLQWDGSRYELEVSFALTFCRSYRHSWTAVALDEETIHVTREGLGCGPGDGDSRICDNQVDIEYVLEQPCESPCKFVDDRQIRLPGADLGDDLILRNSRCEC